MEFWLDHSDLVCVSCSLGEGGAYRLFYVKVGLLKYSSKFLISSCCSSIVCTELINENISSEIFNLKPVSKSNFFLGSRQHRSQRIIRSENCQIFFENSFRGNVIISLRSSAIRIRSIEVKLENKRFEIFFEIYNLKTSKKFNNFPSIAYGRFRGRF